MFFSPLAILLMKDAFPTEGKEWLSDFYSDLFLDAG